MHSKNIFKYAKDIESFVLPTGQAIYFQIELNWFHEFKLLKVIKFNLKNHSKLIILTW